jgi:hypothetical protein
VIGMDYTRARNTLKRVKVEERAGLPHVLSVLLGIKKYEPERDEKRWTFL